MSVVKIRMNTWQRCGNRETKFKRNIAPREGFIEMSSDKKVSLKPGNTKWKPWDITISRKNDAAYIKDRKDLYSGLCFENRKQAENFMVKHKAELDKLASENPLFDHWSVIPIIKRFDPPKKIMYGKDIKED